MRAIVACIVVCLSTTLFSAAQTLTTLVNFVGGNGKDPATALVQASDGNFYGTTLGGGVHDGGTIFKLTADGIYTNLHSFNGTDGSGPDAALIQAKDGEFYGTTPFGGDDSEGTVFKITTSGLLATLHSFTGTEGNSPRARLLQFSDGDFYGLTETGGPYSGGTVFKLTPDGTLTTLYNFCSQSHCSDGIFPFGWLVAGTDGNFYGTTSGGAYSGGTVFKVTPAGTLATLYSFTGPDGSNPWAGLTKGADGSFYGTTPYGGPAGYGTAFKITPEGDLTTIYYFCARSRCSDGSYPYAGLALGSDGNFYGVTAAGGVKQDGTIFKLTPAGDLTTLYSFTGLDGSVPKGELVQGNDGAFYGTTESGGTADYGTVFRFDTGSFGALTVTKSGMGTVSSTDHHIYCGSNCSYSYLKGAQITLSAVPAAGYTIAGWTGCDNVNGNYCSVTIAGATNVLATFADANLTLTSLTFTPSYVKGGRLSAGTLALSGPAPEGGLGVALSSDHPGAAHPPSFVVVPPGKSSVQFTVQTFPVKSSTTATITATTGNSQVSGKLTVGTTLATAMR